MNLQERLTAMLEPLVESLGFELVLLEFNPYRGSASLQLFIDAPGGITLGDCERVSREVEGLLDVEDPIPQGYRLEVSSPGLDRPLVKARDFERFTGSQAKVQLIAPLPGGTDRRKFQGVLRGMQGENVVLETEDAGKVELALQQIERARLVPDYEKELRGS
jgi:ribosome maturation factor RimP